MAFLVAGVLLDDLLVAEDLAAAEPLQLLHQLHSQGDYQEDMVSLMTGQRRQMKQLLMVPLYLGILLLHE